MHLLNMQACNYYACNYAHCMYQSMLSVCANMHKYRKFIDINFPVVMQRDRLDTDT